MRLQQLRPLSERLPLLSRPRSAWCLLFDFLPAFVLQTRSSRCCLVRLPGEKNEIKTFQAGGHCALFKSPHPPSGVGPPHEGTRSHGTGVSARPGLDPWPVCGCPPGRGVGDVPSRRGFIPKASSPRAGRPGSPSKVPPGRRGRLECATLARGASSRLWPDFLHPLEVSGGSRRSLPCSQGLLPAPRGRISPAGFREGDLLHFGVRHFPICQHPKSCERRPHCPEGHETGRRTAPAVLPGPPIRPPSGAVWAVGGGVPPWAPLF